MAYHYSMGSSFGSLPYIHGLGREGEGDGNLGLGPNTTRQGFHRKDLIIKKHRVLARLEGIEGSECEVWSIFKPKRMIANDLMHYDCVWDYFASKCLTSTIINQTILWKVSISWLEQHHICQSITTHLLYQNHPLGPIASKIALAMFLYPQGQRKTNFMPSMPLVFACLKILVAPSPLPLSWKCILYGLWWKSFVCRNMIIYYVS